MEETLCLNPEELARLPAGHTQILLPLDRGGLGIPRLADIAPMAFLGGFKNSMRTLLSGMPELADSDGESSVILAAREAYTYFSFLCPDSQTVTDIPSTVDDFITTEYTQHSLTQEYYDAKEAQWKEAVEATRVANIPHQHKFRMASVSQPLASAFLRAVPTQGMFKLDNLEVRVGVWMRLGLSSDFLPETCPQCASAQEPLHPIRCEEFRRRTQHFRHNRVQNTWRVIFQAAGSRCDLEVPELYADSREDLKPDLRVDHQVHNFGVGEKHLLTDVSFVLPKWSTDVSTRENQKCHKYRITGGMVNTHVFEPLVCDVYGGWGDRALQVWSRCAALHVERHRSFPTAADFKNFYGKYLSMSVVRAHAEMWAAYAQGVQPSRAPNHIPLHVEYVADEPISCFGS